MKRQHRPDGNYHYSELLTGGGGPNQTIKSGPDRVDKPKPCCPSDISAIHRFKESGRPGARILKVCR